jgi:exodeoxyribonuclease VII large subunit
MQVPDQSQIYSVSALNQSARALLESGLGIIWIEGEISNLAQPASGHIYFSLKDQDAQVRCAMFRGSKRKLTFRPDNGLQVLARARVGLYEPRGEFQLVVESLEEAGEGLLRQRLEQLKRQLASEGLFDEKHKVRLPALPQRIGIITSPSGAVIRDILHVLSRRFPGIPVIIYPTPVQGAAAAPGVVAALKTAAERDECDVLVIARGGGSLEDLWAFNEEAVARAIFSCTLPVVSAIGHETDFTISDLVADLRAPTPSAAAELIVPNQTDWLHQLQNISKRSALAIRRLLEMLAERTDQTERRLSLSHPGRILQDHRRTLNELSRQMTDLLTNQLSACRWRQEALVTRVRVASPVGHIQRQQEYIQLHNQRLRQAVRHRLDAAGHELALRATRLQAVSPLDTLRRGYSVVSDSQSGAVIDDATKLKPGDEIQARMSRGSLIAKVKKVQPD